MSKKEQVIRLLKELESLKREFESFKKETKIIINDLKDQNNLLKERLAKYENRVSLVYFYYNKLLGQFFEVHIVKWQRKSEGAL